MGHLKQLLLDKNFKGVRHVDIELGRVLLSAWSAVRERPVLALLTRLLCRKSLSSILLGWFKCRPPSSF